MYMVGEECRKSGVIHRDTGSLVSLMLEGISSLVKIEKKKTSLVIMLYWLELSVDNLKCDHIDMSGEVMDMFLACAVIRTTRRVAECSREN